MPVRLPFVFLYVCTVRGLFLLSLVLLLALSGGCSRTGMIVGAAATGGVAASKDKGFTTAADDTRIRFELNALLLQEDFEIYNAVHLQVEEGRVLLSGNVPTPEDKVQVFRLAWRPEGVNEVIDEMTVDDTSGLSDAALDRWIELRLDTLLLFDVDVKDINYSTEVVNQRVYLIGLARSESERERVVAHAKSVPYVKGVTDYLRVLEDDKETTRPD
ncbi:BON domain-containing protein [Fodinicurvata sediminis]|uniref:BON domain-containing protein n=1 Tax=Fodinicurvata sediminis TaxID=1121832 RepID=UPI0003B617B5|nr:BON domain-containing protein [Fodinicurvata sediminis]